MSNILYDGLLRIRLPLDVEFIAYADDVTIVATATDVIRVNDMRTTAIEQQKTGWPRQGFI